MDNIHQYVDGIASNAVLLAGFTAFFSISPASSTHQGLAGFYYITSIICLLINIYIVVASNLLGALGPTYGICGKAEDAMHRSVALMKRERRWMMSCFMTGFVFFGLCELSAVWIESENVVTNSVCTFILFAGFVFISYEVKRMKKEFHFDELHQEVVGEKETTATVNAERRRSSANKGGRNELLAANKFLASTEMKSELMGIVGDAALDKGRQVSADPMSATRR